MSEIMFQSAINIVIDIESFLYVTKKEVAIICMTSLGLL